VIVVDGGDLFSDRPVLPDDLRAQVEIKARAQIQSYAENGWDVFVPGEADFSVGTEVFFELFDGVEVDILAGNLTCGDRSFSGGKVIERGGYRVGIIGVVSGVYSDCEVGDPVSSAVESMESLGDVDVTLAVVHGPTEVSSEVGLAIAPDFILNGHTGRSANNLSSSDMGWSIGSGIKGKRLGLLQLSWQEAADGWTWSGGTAQVASQLDRYRERLASANSALAAASEEERGRLENRQSHYADQVATLESQLNSLLVGDGESNSFNHTLLEMDESIGEDQPTIDLITATRARIEEVAIASSAEVREATASFAGSAACRGCHNSQWEQWSGTDHAGAWNTLITAERQSDLTCFECHVTGAHHPDGPTHPNNVGVLTGVGCESCHGPRAAHITAVSSGTLTSALASPEVSVESCVKCHDGDRDDGDFDPVTYMEAIRH